MTAHIHDPAAQGGQAHAEPAATGASPLGTSRPRWLVPGLVVAVIAVGLVVAGVLSLSTVLYAGLFGGMVLMHVGGHGHGGHGGHGHGDHGGGGHDGRAQSLRGDGAGDAEDLSRDSLSAQAAQSGSARGLEERGPDISRTSGSDDRDQNRLQVCH